MVPISCQRTEQTLGAFELLHWRISPHGVWRLMPIVVSNKVNKMLRLFRLLEDDVSQTCSNAANYLVNNITKHVEYIIWIMLGIFASVLLVAIETSDPPISTYHAFGSCSNICIGKAIYSIQWKHGMFY